MARVRDNDFGKPAEQVDLCRQILQETGLTAGLMEKQDQ
jgi:hypothetical protein